MTFSSDVAAAIASGAQRHGLDPALVAAIVRQESGGHPESIRFEPGYRYVVDCRSWGPFRKLEEPEVAGSYPPVGFHAVAPCSVATEWSLQRHSLGLMQIMGATAREAGFQGAFLTALLDPAEGIEWGCRYLKRLTRHYSLDAAISAFNAGRPTEVNQQAYVDPVLRYLAEFQKAGI